MRGIFVTATDTGIGKTIVTAALAHALRERGLDAGVSKPVQSGNRVDDPEGDAAVLKQWSGVDDPLEDICPHAFLAPLAPLVAARLEGRRLEIDEVAGAVERIGGRHDVLLVEGAGGLLAPIGEDWTVADLAARLGLPLLVVAHAGLGTVNHTLLTVAEARRRGLEPVAVVLNGRRDDGDRSAETNAQLIEAFCEVPVAAVIPWFQEQGDLVARVAAHLRPGRLLAGLEGEETRRV